MVPIFLVLVGAVEFFLQNNSRGETSLLVLNNKWTRHYKEKPYHRKNSPTLFDTHVENPNTIFFLDCEEKPNISCVVYQ